MNELWKSKIPAGELGTVTVVKRTATEDDVKLHNMRAMWRVFQTRKVVLRLVKSFSGPPEPSSI